jgi:site-specific recombinase XerD
MPSATLQALISLIAATGLRVGEALALDRGDAGLLTVTGKNDQTRLVPLHPATASMLASYAARRDRLCPRPASPALFITSTGQRARQRGVAETFARLVVLAGITMPPGRRRPRVHDLRH